MQQRDRRARGPWWQAATLVVAVVAGLGFAAAARASDGADLRPAPAGLPDIVRARDRVVAGQAAQVDRLEREVGDLTAREVPVNQAVATLSARADTLAPEAGGTPVRGPAVVVALNDSSRDAKHPPAGFTAADMVVHQQDVQAVVNALWRGGAEALMVQDQRIVSTSAVRCVGNTLILQGRVYAPPYTITAIGDTTALRASLDADPTLRIYRQYVEAVGLGYTVTTPGDVTVPAFAGPVKPRRAAVQR